MGKCLAERIVFSLLLASVKHRQESGGQWTTADIESAGVAAQILCRSVFIECAPVHWRIGFAELVRSQAQELNRQLRAVYERQAALYPSRWAACRNIWWPANLLALLLLAGKKASSRLVPCPHLLEAAFPEDRICVSEGDQSSKEDRLLSYFAVERARSQRKQWARFRRESCLEFAIGGEFYPCLKSRVGPKLPNLQWRGGESIRSASFWIEVAAEFNWPVESFDQSIVVDAI